MEKFKIDFSSDIVLVRRRKRVNQETLESYKNKISKRTKLKPVFVEKTAFEPHKHTKSFFVLNKSLKPEKGQHVYFVQDGFYRMMALLAMGKSSAWATYTKTDNRVTNTQKTDYDASLEELADFVDVEDIYALKIDGGKVFIAVPKYLTITGINTLVQQGTYRDLIIPEVLVKKAVSSKLLRKRRGFTDSKLYYYVLTATKKKVEAAFL